MFSVSSALNYFTEELLNHTTYGPCRVLPSVSGGEVIRRTNQQLSFNHYQTSTILAMQSIAKLLRQKRQSRGGQRRQMNATAALPPQYKADPQLQRKLRFQMPVQSSNTTLLVTRFSLFSTYGFSTSSIAATSAYGSIKLNRVQVWTTPANSSSVVSVENINFSSFTWLSETSPNVELSSAGNQFNPGYITTRPPDHSLAGFWTSKVNVGTAGPTTSANLFTIEVQAGTQVIVDIELVYVPCAHGEEVVFNPVGATAGTFTYQPLDNGGLLVPVSNIS